ncbi:hypothetical protein [Algibacter pectinivorans]|uniref:Lipocalin-like domain-containing protein n=1 Tax=Algibacter pectinivorans TaxID=870482 RepID=A0A1I1P4P7_9FLAO|nr:hypothetical protein [Algibacter pectinivorans]SFD04934.1 hypothetical protein SAMN04487987_103186 [Algibacter pectinivorans]
MKNKYYLKIIFSLIIACLSCSKEDSLSAYNILNSKTWHIKSNNLPSSKIYAGLEITELTLFKTSLNKCYSFTFTTDGVLVINDTNNNVVLKTVWTLNSNEKKRSFAKNLITPIPKVGNTRYCSLDITAISSSKIKSTVTMPNNDKVNLFNNHNI